MDNLEKYIRDNRGNFDIFEPSPELWNEVKKKTQPKVRQINYKKILWQAAAVAIIFSISFFIQEYLHQNKQQTNKIANNTAKTEKNVTSQKIVEQYPDLIEAEAYYSTQVKQKFALVKQKTEHLPDLQNDIKADLNELDSTYNDLKKDLNDGIANEQIVDAMIQNYRLKLKILEDILYFLQKANEKEKKDTIKKNNQNDGIYKL